MNTVDKIVTEWAFRCKKGYPDLNNPQDMKILKEIYSELGLVMELEKAIQEEEELEEDYYLQEEEEQQDDEQEEQPEKPTTKGSSYEDIIKHEFEGEIPEVHGTYKLPQTTGDLNIDAKDLANFKKLYKIAPPKKGGEVGSAGSKGSGHGEIAVYWLLKYQKNPYAVHDSRGGSSADLLVGNVGVEVKSYKEGNTGRAIGRIGTYSQILTAMNTLFSIAALYQEFAEKGKKKVPPTALSATKDDFKAANKILVDLDKDTDFKKLQSFNIPFLNSMFAQIEKLKTIYGKEGVDTVASNILKALLLAKFTDKPLGSGDEGYILNVQPSGEIKCTHITKEKLQNLTSDQVLSPGTAINQGILYFNKQIFN